MHTCNAYFVQLGNHLLSVSYYTGILHPSLDLLTLRRQLASVFEFEVQSLVSIHLTCCLVVLI